MKPNHLSLFKLLFIFLISLSVIQCKKEKENDSPAPGFTEYISAYTSGIVSNRSAIRIRLVTPAVKAEPNQIIEEKIFSFDPEIEGKSYWTDNQTIEFRPDRLLPPGTEFKGKFHLSEITDVAKDLEYFPFKFQTIPQNIEA